jgi:hypothetical protein
MILEEAGGAVCCCYELVLQLPCVENVCKNSILPEVYLGSSHICGPLPDTEPER